MNKVFVKLNSILSISLLLCSCAERFKYEVDKYLVGSFETKENFTICQLNDIHLSMATDLDRQFDYVSRLIDSRNLLEEESFDKPDILVLNGDTFMEANEAVVTKWFDMLDSLKIPYCFNYGNHDKQGTYSNDFIDNTLIEHKYNGINHFALYPETQNDEVYGSSNYYVNITDSGNTIFQIYILDSNTYNGFEYDVIHEDQIEWYEECVRYSNGLSKNDPIKENMIKSLMFFHIPNIDFEYAIGQYAEYDEVYRYVDHQDELDLDYLDKQEKIANSRQDDNLFETIQKLKSTVGIGAAHDHINNCDIHYSGDGDFPVRFIYGLKSTDGIYHDEETLGATFYELKDTPYTRTTKDGNTSYKEYFDLKMIHMSYEGEAKYLWQTKDTH